MTENSWNLLSIGSRPSWQGPGSIPDLTSQTHLHGINSLWTCMQNSFWRQTRNRPMPLTSSVMRQSILNISGCTVARKKIQMLRKKLSSFWNSFKFAFLRKSVYLYWRCDNAACAYFVAARSRTNLNQFEFVRQIAANMIFTSHEATCCSNLSQWFAAWCVSAFTICEGRTGGGGGGPSGTVHERKNRESRVTDIKISFSQITKISN